MASSARGVVSCHLNNLKRAIASSEPPTPRKYGSPYPVQTPPKPAKANAAEPAPVAPQAALAPEPAPASIDVVEPAGQPDLSTFAGRLAKYWRSAGCGAAVLTILLPAAALGGELTLGATALVAVAVSVFTGTGLGYALRGE